MTANPIQTSNNKLTPRSLLRTAVFGRDWRVTLVRAAIWGVIVIVLWEFILTPFRVDGISMLPSYRDRAVNVVNHLAYLRHEPQRGDVVAIRINPETPAAEPFISGLKVPAHAMLLKRIVGLPGESIAFSNGHIFINGDLLNEPYETLRCDWDRGAVTLGADEYFVVGDNRTMPQEYHYFGRCKRSLIIGKVLL